MRSALPAGPEGLVDTLRANRLTVLIGSAGSGKTTLLREEVLPRLRRRRDDATHGGSPGTPEATERRRATVRPRELVVWCDDWDGPPAAQVHACLDAATGVPPPAPGTLRPTLALRAKALSAEHAARLLFVFDHGDRIAAAPSGESDPAAEYDALVSALCSVSPSVHVLLTARDGALPPSVQARLGSPDTRTLRLPDPTDGAPPPGAVETGRPMQRDEVYAAIAERLGAVVVRHDVPAWGAAAGHRHEPFPAPEAADGGPAESPVASWPQGLGDAAVPAPPPVEPGPFAPDSFASTSAHRSRGARRVRGARLALALAAVAGLGVALWLARADPASWPQPSDRRLAAAAARGRGPPRNAGPTAIAPRPDEAASTLLAGPEEPRPSPPSIAATPTVLPSMAATTAASALPAASADARTRPAAAERRAEAPLADDLWREMSLHGLARLAVGAADDPVEALAAGSRLAVVPYDALRALATSRGTVPAARIVAPLFTEEMHVIVRADSPLAFIHQIAGQRIDVGPPRSGRRQTALAFLERLFARPLTADERRGADRDTALAELLDGQVDAIVLAEPQPSAWLSNLPTAQRARLRLLGAASGDPSTRRALRSFLPASLSAPAATGGPAVKTFAVMTFLVANPAMPAGRDDTATVTAKALCRSLPELRRDGHPKWREVDVTLQLPVPLPYDPEAATVLRACDAGRDAAARRPADPVIGTGHETPPRGERE